MKVIISVESLHCSGNATGRTVNQNIINNFIPSKDIRPASNHIIEAFVIPVVSQARTFIINHLSASTAEQLMAEPELISISPFDRFVDFHFPTLYVPSQNSN